VFTLDADTIVHAALKVMRETRNLAVTDAGAVLEVIILADVLRRLFPHATTVPA
jgi:hypothetical protein